MIANYLYTLKEMKHRLGLDHWRYRTDNFHEREAVAAAIEALCREQSLQPAFARAKQWVEGLDESNPQKEYRERVKAEFAEDRLRKMSS